MSTRFLDVLLFFFFSDTDLESDLRSIDLEERTETNIYNILFNTMLGLESYLYESFLSTLREKI